MNDKIFNLLSNGGKFKSENNKKTVDLFNNGKVIDTLPIDEQNTTDLVDDLDFFGYDTNEEKKEHQEEESKSEEESESEIEEETEESSEEEEEVAPNEKEEQSDSDSSIALTKEDQEDSDESMEEEETKKETTEKIDLNNEEAIALFRKRMKIRVTGGDIPAPISSFEDMYFKPEQKQLQRLVLRNIEHAVYKEPTPVQMQSIPAIYQKRDVVATAPTGSGKTAAYLLPLIPMLDKLSNDGVRVIIISPSHELCCQIQREWKKLTDGRKFRCVVLTKSTISGYVNNQTQTDILISTPMRLIDAIENHNLLLSNLQTIIFDEADKLFEENFIEQLDKVLQLCNNKHLQRIMFSATLPENIDNMIQTILRDPVYICIETRNTSNENIKQELLFVGKEEGKLIALRQLFQAGIDPPVLIFVQSKDRAQELYHELAYDGLNIDVLHSDRPVQQRELIINKFRLREIWVLICTDLVARGLDFKGVNLVINYDFPQSGISYIHRIGRTGRAGKEGHAITYFTEDDYPMLRSIANIMKISGCEVPDWMLKMKKLDRKSRKRLEHGAIKRESISTVTVYDKKKKNKKVRAVKRTQRQKQKKD